MRDVRWSLAFPLGICALVGLGLSTARSAGGAAGPRTSGPVGGRAPSLGAARRFRRRRRCPHADATRSG